MREEDSTFGAEPQHLDRLISLGLESREEDAAVLGEPQFEGPGGWVGRYKLLEKIGEGGMGVVYRARQEQPICRTVALKIIKLGMDTRHVIARFEAERQALALMEHPHIARVLDAGATETGRPYFVMELVTGVSITEYCDQNCLSTRDRLALFLQVCHAVQHAHQKGIIHRDIKPSNVLVTRVDGTPVPKIIDFGIAKATNQHLTAKTLFTLDGHVLGTPVYMSPEQMELGDLDTDTRSDIYSLGVLLYELLTGTTPFSQEQMRQVAYVEMQRVIREQVPAKPSTKLTTLGASLTEVAQRRRTTAELLGKALRGDLDWVVMKTLEKDRVRRYETVAGLAEDIRRHLEHEPVLARGPTASYRLAKFFRRHRSQVLAVIVLVVFAAAAGIVLPLWRRDRQRLAEVDGIRHQACLSQARGQYAQGERQAALETVTPLLLSRHVGPEAQLLYAGILVEGRLPEEAAAVLTDLLAERREIAGAAHALWARLLWEGGSLSTETLKEIEEHRRQAQALFPETAEAYFLRAMGAFTIKEQLAALAKALQLDPNHYESRRLRAFTYCASRKYEEMKEDALRMTILAPLDPWGYSLHALACQQLRRFPEAVVEYDRALALTPASDPHYVELLGRRGETLMQMGQYERALIDAHEALKQAPDAVVLLSQVFCAATALGRYEEAGALMQRLAESPGEADNQVQLQSMKHVFDALTSGGRWHPPGSAPKGPAFFYMRETEDMYGELSAKAHRLIADGFVPCWSPDGTKVAFAAGLPGCCGVAVYDLATKETDLLIAPGKDPSWSPDNRRIAFVRDAPALRPSDLATGRTRVGSGAYAYGCEVWVMEADGSEPRLLARHAGAPSWSADAQRVYYFSHLDGMLCSILVEDPQAQPVPVFAHNRDYPVPSPQEEHVAILEGWIQNNAVVRIMDVATHSCVAEWATPLESSSVVWSPDERELSLGGLYKGIRNRMGLWIYDVTKKEGVKVLNARISTASWSQDRTRLLLHLSQPYWEIWVADLDPELPTAESLKPVQTLQEHCREAIATSNRDLEVDPESTVSRWTRTAAALWIGHPQAPAYLQDLDLALDRRAAVPSDDQMRALHILRRPELCQRLEPLAWILARWVVEHQASYAVELAAEFDRVGQREHAAQLRQLAQVNMPKGSCRYDRGSDTYVVIGGGADIWGTIDEFHFVCKRLDGDGSITAKIESLEDVRTEAKAGVMIRASLDASAKYAAVYVTPSGGVTYQARPIFLAFRDDHLATPEQTALRAPVWVRIERKGDQFCASYSSDGVTWTPMVWSPQTVSMPESVYIGLAVTSHDNQKTAEARISHVTTTGAVRGAGPFTESQDIALPFPVSPGPP
jgi:serine/threonine protein kinase/tetratricopeptide (TPR) repeat protein/regulation of enolase protein 1 (concanavalin A-like superfamily)